MNWISCKLTFQTVWSQAQAPHIPPLLQNTHIYILDLSAQNVAGNTAASLAAFYNVDYLFPAVSVGQDTPWPERGFVINMHISVFIDETDVVVVVVVIVLGIRYYSTLRLYYMSLSLSLSIYIYMEWVQPFIGLKVS